VHLSIGVHWPETTPCGIIWAKELKMLKPKHYYLVVWEDPATEYDSWFDINSMSAKDPSLVFSLGWESRDDTNHLYILMDWSENKGNTVGKIPLSAIRYLKKIKLTGFPAEKFRYPKPEELSSDSEN
jgi:hypothetical protein